MSPGTRARGTATAASSTDATSTPHPSAVLTSTERSSAADDATRARPRTTTPRPIRSRAGERHPQEDRAQDRGDGEEAGHDRLHHEQRQRPHGDQGQHEPEAVEPTPSTYLHECTSRTSSRGSRPSTDVGTARGDGLEDRADAVAERRGEGRQQTQQHPMTLAEARVAAGAGSGTLVAMRSTRLERRHSVADVVDGCFFAFSGAAAIWLAYLLLRDGVRSGWSLLMLLVFWLFFTYLVLPRLHRILTEIYVPGYFIGRARTSDGLLGDPVNLGLHGSEGQVHRVDDGRGLDPGRRARLPGRPPDRAERARAAQLPRGAGQPADAVRPAAGLRLPAGARRESLAPPPCAVLALSGGVAAAGRVPRRLAGGRRPSTARSGSRCSRSR